MRNTTILGLAVLLFLAGSVAGSPVVDPAAPVFINEFHYDNDGTDTGEAIEIAGPAGTVLTGWKLVLYNGANGLAYTTTTLSGTIPNQQGGFGTLSFSYPANGLQNGSPDGIALVSPTNVVVEFLSYEGTFAAADGPAGGLTSTDVVVQEGATTAVGASLQRRGTGKFAGDFTWEGPLTATFGGVNTNQTFAANRSPVAVADSVVTPPGVSVTIPVLANDTEPDGDSIVLQSVSAPVHGSALIVGLEVQYSPAPGYSGLDTFTYTINDGQGATAVGNVNVVVATLPLRIHDIQGAGHTSSFLGYSATGVVGVVTAVLSNGYYLQDPDADANPATSEGIFVFTGTNGLKPVVGDSLSVNGKVAEFFAGANNLSTTEISTPTSFTVLATGVPLPAPVTIGAVPFLVDRAIPTGAIDDDSFAVFDPENDAIDFYESLEGMRVKVDAAVVVMGTNAFSEIVVLADLGLGSAPRTIRGGVRVRPGDFNPERIMLDDSALPFQSPTVQVGDVFQGPIVGVMNYDFANFRISFTQPLPAVWAAGHPKQKTHLQGGAKKLTVATCNLENLSAGDPRIPSFAAFIAENLKLPDILSLEEVGDNNGTAGGVVSSDQTLSELAAEVLAQTGVAYSFRYIAPVENQDGGEPGRNIRVSFFYRPDRVTFVDRPGGNATTPVQVLAGPVLSISPGRIDPANPAFVNSRKPLVGEFEFLGRKVFIVANHFNSKGGDQPLFGRFQPPVLSSEVQRLGQATAVHAFVQSLQQAIDAAGADAGIIVMGDLNDFEFSAPLATLKGTLLEDLMDQVPSPDRYTYDFEGNSQVLDHILIGGAFLKKGYQVDVDPVHANADYAVADRLSDHDPVVASVTFLKK